MAGWLALAGGCAAPAVPTAPATPQTPAPPPPSNQSSADRRYVLSPGLEPVIRVLNVRLIHPPRDFLKIQVNVQNKTETPQRFRYRIEWFDADGERLPLPGGELRLWTLLPHEMSSIAVTAPAHAATDFEIAFVP